MTHNLARICGPEVFGYVAWVCTCGHRSGSYSEHERHEEAEA